MTRRSPFDAPDTRLVVRLDGGGMVAQSFTTVDQMCRIVDSLCPFIPLSRNPEWSVET